MLCTNINLYGLIIEIKYIDKLYKLVRTTQEYQRFLEDTVMELLKEGVSYRKRSPLPSIITQAKQLRGNHDWQALGGIRACTIEYIAWTSRMGVLVERSVVKGVALRSRGVSYSMSTYMT